MPKIKEDSDRLRFYGVKMVSTALRRCTIKYRSTTSAIQYRCEPVPDPERRGRSWHPWNNYILWRGSKRLGTYRTSLDAKLAAQKDYDEMRKQC